MPDQKERLESLSEAIMAPEKQAQETRAARLRPRWVDPRWQTFGLGLTGLAVGAAVGSGYDSAFVHGCIGLVAGLGLGALIARMRRDEPRGSGKPGT